MRVEELAKESPTTIVSLADHLWSGRVLAGDYKEANEVAIMAARAAGALAQWDVVDMWVMRGLDSPGMSPEEECRLLCFSGIRLLYLGHYQDAIRAFNSCIVEASYLVRVARSFPHDDRRRHVNLYMAAQLNLAMAQEGAGETTLAIEQYKRSLLLCQRKQGMPSHLAACLGGLAWMLLMYTNRPKAAARYLEQLRGVEHVPAEAPVAAATLAILDGILLWRQGNTDAATDLAKKVLAKDDCTDALHADAHWLLGYIALKGDNPQLALYYAKQARVLAETEPWSMQIRRIDNLIDTCRQAAEAG